MRQVWSHISIASSVLFAYLLECLSLILCMTCKSQGDTVGRVKERMQERLGVNDKVRIAWSFPFASLDCSSPSNTMFTQEWDKFKVAFVLQGKPHFVEEDDKVINTKVRSARAACNYTLPILNWYFFPSGVPWNGTPVPWTPAGWTTLDRSWTHKQGE